MKFVEIEFEVTDDGDLITYRTSEVPGEVHEDMERALAQLEEMLGTVVERRSVRPGFQRHAHQHRKQGIQGS
ncbi:MAG: hypothetical protein H6807_13930 [Planctomycetes bacterium]|nr:hypothetical protein [Planctomycetota bacterium]